ncbi:serine protease 33-like [Amphibalanus amphitrite]|uniref:serine protease 33-like n=1 Tax=Amphibalanus amphitrite TaxID=1232801 RepID=UPI001C91080B|nr:serine protease 33-like [Amphibalanus amphitrite]
MKSAAAGRRLLCGITAAEASRARFVTYGADDGAVERCRDALSYLCGNTTEHRCVSPRAFCDGITSCASGWDEQYCDKALPLYTKTDEALASTGLIWMSMSAAACAKLCDNSPGCQGFSHHGLYSRCQIHTSEGERSALGDRWTSYRRSLPAESSGTRSARYLDLLDSSAASEQPPGSEAAHTGRTRRRRRQAGHMMAPGLTKSAGGGRCGSQPVFYMPPRKLVATTRIVGGSEVPYGAFPWQAEIKVLQDGYRTHQCGGAVISQQYILTAAHCVVTHNKDDYMVILGDHDLANLDPLESTFFIEKILVHPGYNRATKKHDIALLKLRPNLRKQSTYNEKTRPVCLPEASVPRPGTECVVTGWGLMDPNDDASLSTSLRAAMVSIIAEKECASDAVYGTKKHFSGDGMMCAGYLRGGVDACKGDSGGPLACKIDGRFQLVGVVSWGDSCAQANKPGVYTRVSQYMDWIQSNMR